MNLLEVIAALLVWLLVIPVAVVGTAVALYLWESVQLRRGDGSGDRYAS